MAKAKIIILMTLGILLGLLLLVGLPTIMSPGEGLLPLEITLILTVVGLFFGVGFGIMFIAGTDKGFLKSRYG